MKLRKPPVIEAWIEFKIDLTDEHSVWAGNASNEFLTEHFPSFSHTDQMALAKITIDPRTHKPTTEIAGIERVRAFTENRDKCIQVGRDVVILNHIKKEDSWPGYDKLEPEAIDVLEKYLTFRGLTKVAGVALHYRDVCRMPQDEQGRLKLEKYFRVHPRVPDEVFRTIQGFKIEVRMDQVCEAGTVFLTMQSLPTVEKATSEMAFGMDWHIVCTKTIETVGIARQWLGSAHNALRGIFKGTFTDEGFAQFEPQDEE